MPKHKTARLVSDDHLVDCTSRYLSVIVIIRKWIELCVFSCDVSLQGLTAFRLHIARIAAVQWLWPVIVNNMTMHTRISHTPRAQLTRATRKYLQGINCWSTWLSTMMGFTCSLCLMSLYLSHCTTGYTYRLSSAWSNAKCFSSTRLLQLLCWHNGQAYIFSPSTTTAEKRMEATE